MNKSKQGHNMNIINENLSLAYRYANKIANIVNSVENDIKYRQDRHIQDFYIPVNPVKDNEIYKGESICIYICTPASFKKQCKIRGVTEDAFGFYNEYLNCIYIKYDYETCGKEELFNLIAHEIDHYFDFQVCRCNNSETPTRGDEFLKNINVTTKVMHNLLSLESKESKKCAYIIYYLWNPTEFNAHFDSPDEYKLIGKYIDELNQYGESNEIWGSDYMQILYNHYHNIDNRSNITKPALIKKFFIKRSKYLYHKFEDILQRRKMSIANYNRENSRLDSPYDESINIMGEVIPYFRYKGKTLRNKKGKYIYKYLSTNHPELSNRDKYNILKNKEYRKKNNKNNTMQGLIAECIHNALLSYIEK